MALGMLRIKKTFLHDKENKMFLRHNQFANKFSRYEEKKGPLLCAIVHILALKLPL